MAKKNTFLPPVEGGKLSGGFLHLCLFGPYASLLKDLSLKPEDVPLLAGEVVHKDQNGACASMNPIINELPKIIPNAHVISSAGCTVRPDRLHFTPAGYRELGKRYGQKC